MGKKVRAHGEGTAYQRPNGTWAAQIVVGIRPDGKSDRRTVYGRTKKAATDKLAVIKGESRDGKLADLNRVTVAEHIERWLTVVIADKIRPVTLQSYRIALEVYAIPFIGHHRLSALTPRHLEDLYKARQDAGKSRRTVQYLHSVLRRALAHAVTVGLLARNPADSVQAPQPARREFNVLTPDDMQTLMVVIEGHVLEPLIRLAMDTGARRGELIALRWSDMNIDDPIRPAIHINRTAELVGKSVIWSEPKTAKSRRRIPITAEVAAVLRQHRVKQSQEQIAAGDFWKDDGLVFCKGDGTPLNPANVTQQFSYLVSKHKLPKVRLHDLRHSLATLLLAANVHPKIVSERLGHSTTNLTMNTYSHVLPTMQDAVTETLGLLLKKDSTRAKKSG